MNLDSFIQRNRVQKADAIIVRKKFLGLLSHYVIYLGRESEYESTDRYSRSQRYYRGGRDGHLFMANMSGGVKVLREGHLREYLIYLEPNRINRFQGGEQARKAAIARALSKQNENSYDLILNNCEHFATYVQEGKARSGQSQNAGLALGALLLLGLGAAFLSGSDDDD